MKIVTNFMRLFERAYQNQNGFKTEISFITAILYIYPPILCVSRGNHTLLESRAGFQTGKRTL